MDGEKMFDLKLLGYVNDNLAYLSQLHLLGPEFQAPAYLRGHIGHYLCRRALSSCSCFPVPTIPFRRSIEPVFGLQFS